MNRVTSTGAALWCMALCSDRAIAVVGGTAPPAAETRFDAVGGIIDNLNHRTTPYASAVLISIDPPLVVSAAHAADYLSHGGSYPGYVAPNPCDMVVRFRRGTNGGIDNPQDIAVTRWVPVATYAGYGPLAGPTGEDAVVGILDHAPLNVQPIHVLRNRFARGADPAQTAPGDLVLAGWGPDDDAGDNAGVLRTGLTNAVATSIGGPVQEEIWFNASRCHGGLGDSGGAVLLEDCWGRMNLIGIITTTVAGPTVYGVEDTPGFTWTLPMRTAADLDLFPVGSSSQTAGDGVLNDSDYRAFAAAWRDGESQNPDPAISGYRGLCADYNDDGQVTDADYYQFVQDFVAFGGQYCYANCDGSTISPVLNVSDVTCFVARFAAGDAYANCDGSTTPPVLNAADFSCFLTKFAQGCP